MGDWADDFSSWADDQLDREPKFCDFCGYGPLEWAEIRGLHNRKKWALFTDRGEIHNCRVADPDEEFEDLDK